MTNAGGALDERVVSLLNEAGYDTNAKIAGASDDDLLAINGIGPKSLKDIREAIPSVEPETRKPGYGDGPLPGERV